MSYNNTTFAVENTDSETSDALITISEEAYEEFAFICNTIVNPIICLFGLIGGCLGIGVLYKDARRQKLSIYIFLWGLTFADTVYLLLGLVRTVPYIITHYNKEMANYIEEHMKLGTIYLDMLFSHTSVAIIVVMSLERCLALLRPFTVKNSWLAKYPKRIIALCYIFNFLFLLPYAIFFEVNSYEQDNITDYYIQFKPKAVGAMDKYMLVQTVVDYFLPAAILVLVNTTIIITFSKIKKTRERMFNMMETNINNQQAKVTVTVIVITILYFLLSIPNLTIKILAFLDEEYSFDGKNRVAFWLFIDVSNLFAYLNAANDCLVYILISSHYRNIFTQMYCKCLDRPSTPTIGNGEVVTSDRTGDSVLTDSSRY